MSLFYYLKDAFVIFIISTKVILKHLYVRIKYNTEKWVIKVVGEFKKYLKIF